MMEPEDWIESRVIQICHVSTAASNTVDHVMNRFQAVYIPKICAKCVGLGAEFAVVAVECEKVV